MGRSADTDGIAFSPDGRLVATAHANTAFVWEIDSGRLVTHMHLPGKAAAFHLPFSAEGRRLVVAVVQDRAIRWFDLRTGRQLAERPHQLPTRPHLLRPDDYQSPFVAFGPVAVWMIVSDPDYRYCLSRVDTEHGTRLVSFDGTHADPHRGLAMSRDGNRFAVGSYTGPLVFDTATGKQVRQLPLDGDPRPRDCFVGQFSPDGTQLTVRIDHNTRSELGIWSLSDGSLRTITDATGAILVTADGRLAEVNARVGGSRLFDRPAYRLPSPSISHLFGTDGGTLAAISDGVRG